MELCCNSEELLEGNLCALLLELCLGCLCILLGELLLDDLRCALDEVLGLLEAEAGQLTDNLDDLDLVRANLSQLNVELGLLFLSRSSSAASCDNNTCSCGNAELFLASLDKIVSFSSRTDNSLIASMISCVDNFAILFSSI